MSDPFAAGLRRLRRRSLIRRLTIIGALLVVLVVAALLWPRPVPGPLHVVRATGDATAGGVLEGRLDAERAGDVVCFTTVARGRPAVLTFPAGWSADAQLGLVDPAGSVVAAPGDVVRALGTPGAVGRPAACSGSGRLWSVSSVQVQQAG